MGTRADFYIGRGENAEWLGSIAWDGYPEGITENVLTATDETEYRNAVSAFLSDRDDATMPDQGWPWPWNDSCTTDYAYAFDNGKVWAAPFGHYWYDPAHRDPREDEDTPGKECVFPDMSERKNIALGPTRSGVFILRG